MDHVFDLNAPAEPSTVSGVLTPLADAVAEIQRRRADTDLRRQVEDFLQGDIPDYLDGSQPTLFLARHVATPNFETLHFVDLARPFGLPIAIGQDSHDRFVAHNAMKRALGKLPVQCEGQRRLQHVTIIDFATAQGKRLCDVSTLDGQPLLAFHAGLMRKAALDDVRIVDDASWIDRQRRGTLHEHYKRFLALFVAHGVMLEHYIADDASLIRDALLPAIHFITRQFGARPLIANLVEGVAPPLDWDAYPEHVYRQIDRLRRGPS